MTDNNHKDLQKSSTERIAKRIARAGICSRRDAEKLIEQGLVSVNGEVIQSPALNVSAKDKIAIKGQIIDNKVEKNRVFIYHKPEGLVTTHKDEKGRPTVFDSLPKDLPRVISVGRLDLNSEGLLILTNDGQISRALEHPRSNLRREYKVRVFGDVTQEELDKLAKGKNVQGVQYGPIEAKILSDKGKNKWLSVAIYEGKNREIRKIMESLGLRVNRLIRIAYGPFELGNLEKGATKEVKDSKIKSYLENLVRQFEKLS